jgi:hypothetical protein
VATTRDPALLESGLLLDHEKATLSNTWKATGRLEIGVSSRSSATDVGNPSPPESAGEEPDTLIPDRV